MKIAIIDDEESARNKLVELIDDYDKRCDLQICAFASAQEFLDTDYKENSIVILDIDMPNMNGIELSSKIIESKPSMIIIFATNYDSYTKQAFRNNAFQYLTKPITKEDLYCDLDRAIKKVLRQVEKIKIVSQGVDVLLYINSIVYVESEKRRVKIHMKDGVIYESYMKLNELYSQLVNSNFGISHKSYIVNMSMVETIEQEHIKLIDGQVLPISRKYRGSFKDNFNIYLSGVVL